MSDGRAFSWTVLLPADTSFRCAGWDEAEASLNTEHGDGRHILVVGPGQGIAATLQDNCDGVVARGLNRSSFLRDLPYLREYAVVPSLADARWFVPLGRAGVSARALMLYRPFRLQAKVKARLAVLAARAHTSVWYGDRITLALRRPPELQTTLDALAGDRTTLALATGTPGPRRKVTCAALGDSGPTLFAKIAVTEAGAERVRHEATVLRAVSVWEASPLAPELLQAGVLAGREALVQRRLPGRTPPTYLASEHSRYLARLRHQVCRPWSQTAWVRQLRKRLACLGEPELTSAFGKAALSLDGQSLPVAVLHGDFAPWNLRQDGSELRALDWEFGCMEGLPQIDRAHHTLRVGSLVRDWTPGRAASALHDLEPEQGITAEARDALHQLMVLELLLRLAEDGLERSTEYGYLHAVLRLLGDLTEERGT